MNVELKTTTMEIPVLIVKDTQRHYTDKNRVEWVIARYPIDDPHLINDDAQVWIDNHMYIKLRQVCPIKN